MNTKSEAKSFSTTGYYFRQLIRLPPKTPKNITLLLFTATIFEINYKTDYKPERMISFFYLSNEFGALKTFSNS